MKKMKKAKKVGLASMDIIDVAKNAEASLARRASRAVDTVLPDDHPLKSEIDKQKSMLGDLADLPPGHPLLVTLEAAKERYYLLEEQKENEQTKAKKTNSAKKAAAIRAAAAQRREEEEQAEVRLAAVKDVNLGIKKVTNALTKLNEIVLKHEEILNTESFSRAKAGRLKRILSVTVRGVSECNMARVR